MKRNFVTYENKNPKDFTSPLEEIVREGARKMIQAAIEHEVDEYIESFKEIKNDKGHRKVIRNGYLPKRDLQTGIGPISIHKPRVRDKNFVSTILPRYMRRCPSIDALIPVLYLKGISTGNFQEALEAILGENAKGLSPTNIVRLKQLWEEEYKGWLKRLV